MVGAAGWAWGRGLGAAGALLIATGTAPARADDDSFQRRPSKYSHYDDEARERERSGPGGRSYWYGWQTLSVDAAGIGLLFGRRDETETMAVVTWGALIGAMTAITLDATALAWGKRPPVTTGSVVPRLVVTDTHVRVGLQGAF